MAFTWEPMQAVVWSWYRLMSDIGAFWLESSSDKGYSNGRQDRSGGPQSTRSSSEICPRCSCPH